MNMIEKVARALALAHGSQITGPSRHRASDEFGWDIGHEYMRKYIDKHWKEHEHAAKFAIEAMREPTAAMVDAAHKADGTGMPLAIGYDEAWRAMTDAALREADRP